MSGALILSVTPPSLLPPCRFRQTLWQEVNLEEAEQTLEAIWTASCKLPAEQQEWEATRKLQIDICHYQDLLPLLRKLHSKVREETALVDFMATLSVCLSVFVHPYICPSVCLQVVRNRHWLQVMAVTNCTFQLEGTVFRLAHILEAGLPQ